uniref:Integrase catalytic domain-containing protein n=1 Tax=Fagus sylvatica TaxID=28930 RepID=A0A2N9GCP2_FAGSY
MELTRLLMLGFEASKPYLFLSLNELFLAIFMILVESVTSSGISALVIVVYEHVIATILLAILAFFLEKITLCQLLMTVALQFVASSYESVGLNLVPSVVFVMALIFRQEKLICWSINGQAKIWGIIVSAAGALAVVLWKGPVLLTSTMSNIQATSDGLIGGIMIVVGVLATSLWNITVLEFPQDHLLKSKPASIAVHVTSRVLRVPLELIEEHVTQFYPAELSLSAMMSFFGTIQTAVISLFVISWSSWELKWEGGLVLVTILLGGIVVTGLSYYVMTWSIKKKGPVFTSAFNPLLVVFSFLLQTFVLGYSAHLGRTLYKPSRHTETSHKTFEGATAGRASVVASSQHTDLNEGSARRADQGAISKEPGSHSSDRGNARRSLKYTSTASRAEDSERVISELRREIYDLKQPLESGRHSRSRQPLHSGKGPRTKEHTFRKTARPGGQHAIWKVLDLTYNDIDGCDEEVAVRTFKLGLPPDTGLRQSLTKRPAPTVGKLMHKIDQFIWVEEDGGGTTSVQTVAQPKVITPRPSARSSPVVKSLSSPSDFVAPSFRAFETIFKEPIYKLMEKIKREPFFVWPPKLLRNPDLRDGKLYCTYHKDTGHMTENCHKLKVHLEQLVSAGHLNQYRGIEANLDKIKAILDMQPPRTTKETLGLTERIAALNRFISRSTNICLPFFKILKKAFEWTDECQQAFEKLKIYLASPPLLNPSKQGEELCLYLAVSPTPVNSALIREEAIKAQALADFLAKFTVKDDEPKEEEPQISRWTVRTDGSSTKSVGGVGVILKLPEGDIIRRALDIHNDSQLVVGQVNGDYEAKEKRMQRYLNLVQHQISQFQGVKITRIPREQNATANQLARCLAPAEAEYVLKEIHEGICGNHSGARSLSKKIVRARPFLIGRRQLKFLVVTIDYLTKWVEAEPLATITKKNIQSFVWKAVICRFDIPRVLVSDNGKQFDNPRFRKFSQELGIHNHYSSPGHPQANGQVEVTNRSLPQNAI